jgi:F-type H+-transporting ATPase subunit O
MANQRVCSILSRQVRSFSTTPSVKAAEKIQAPIQLYGVEGRYAHALYAAASRKNQLDAVDKDFQNLNNIFKKEKNLNALLKNPLLTKEQKQNAVRELGTNQKANELTVNTLAVLAENGRLGRLQKIIKSFGLLMSAHKGEVSGKVTSAKPLDSAQLKELQAVLQSFLKQGHKLQLETQVNPELMGGFIIELGDRYIDLSTSSKVKTFTNIVKETI